MSAVPSLPLTYSASKIRMVVLLLGALGFVALGLWLAIHANEIAITSQRNPFTVRLIGYACCLFFGLGIFVALKGLFMDMKMFDVMEEGIVIYTNFGSASYLARWDAIDHFGTVTQQVKRTKIKYIGVFLKDTSSYYTSLKPIQTKLAQFNDGLFGTPLVLNTRAVAVDQQALLGWLNQYLTAYGNV